MLLNMNLYNANFLVESFLMKPTYPPHILKMLAYNPAYEMSDIGQKETYVPLGPTNFNTAETKGSISILVLYKSLLAMGKSKRPVKRKTQ